METTDRPRLSPEDYLADGITLAKRLLGCALFHRTEEGLAGGIIVETEAYMGLADDAAHSYRGRPDGRVNVQYGPGGFAYIYLIYGMHSCMNVTANREGVPEAVLIRALRPAAGLSLMERRRPKAKNERQLCSGPGRLCQALGITRAQYGLSLRGEELWIADRETVPPITAARRIGVDYAVRCRDMPWRFVIGDDPFVSVPPGKEKPHE